MNIGAIPEIWARRTPDRVALVNGASGHSLTWRDVENRTASLAAALRAVCGVRANDSVAVLSGNSTEYFETIYATARLGANAAGLNWRTAVDELCKWLEAINPKVLVCEDVLGEKGAALAKSFGIQLLTFGPQSDGSYERLIEKGAQSEKVAYAGLFGRDIPVLTINTGGTTGTSKGAVHTQGSLQAIFETQAMAQSITSDDCYLMMGQMFHIVAAIPLAYASRGCTVTHINFEPELALDTMTRYSVTSTTGLPTMLDYLIKVNDEQGVELPRWRTMQYGGGPFAPRLIKQLLDRFPCDLLQAYGCSETNVATYLWPEEHRRAVAEGNDDLLRTGGREFGLVQVAVVDPDRNEVDRDGKTVGEILVRSPTMFKCYSSDPASPLRDGWFATGDLATWDSDRYITVAGRSKEMIISGGENIYPAHLERAIRELDGVLEAAVIGMPDDRWGETPVAFVVTAPNGDLDAAAVTAHVERSLGSWQRPRDVVFVDALPKNPNGKVMKTELRGLVDESGSTRAPLSADVEASPPT
jgi:acyl-CoA synthetase (AMP-forming)/AMP-acid ligase II